MTVTPPIHRHSRTGLYVPLLIALALLAGWTGWWFYLTHRIETGIEARAVEMRAAGWDIGHGRITTTGWPFRTRIAIAYPTVTAPDGHAISAPTLVAEANTYNPDKWVIIAPDGLVLTRPDIGKVAVRGDALRHLPRPADPAGPAGLHRPSRGRPLPDPAGRPGADQRPAASDRDGRNGRHERGRRCPVPPDRGPGAPRRGAGPACRPGSGLGLDRNHDRGGRPPAWPGHAR